MVGVVEKVGTDVTNVKPGDRVTVNVETFCGECFFCKNGYVNNCTDPNGGWALGCRIDGGQTEYVRVPLANQGLNLIPASVTDEQALLVGDVLATGFWAARISEITEDDTVLIIGAGPTPQSFWTGTTMCDDVRIFLVAPLAGYDYKKAAEDMATAIDTVENGAEAVTVAGIYSISGAKVASLQNGVNIVKYSDGSVKKVLVK